MTKITLHGNLSEKVGRKVWNLSVSSVKEAIRAIESQSKKLYKAFISNDKKDIKYRILINGKDFLFDESKNVNSAEGLNASELAMALPKIKTIDFVPVFEGAGGGGDDGGTDAKSIIAIVAGIALIAFSFGNPALIMAGIGLIAAGVTNLLTPKPKFDDFEEIESGGGKKNELFSGPQNTIKEGGPVFVGYGRLLIGSHVIHSTLKTFDVENGEEIDKSKYTRYSYWGNEYYGLDYRNQILIPDPENPDRNIKVNTANQAKEEVTNRELSSLSIPTQNAVGQVTNYPGGEETEFVFELQDGSYFYCNNSEVNNS